MKKETVFGIFLSLILLACGLQIPSRQIGELLFYDDFSSTGNNWDTWYQEGFSAASELNDAMVIIVEKSNIDVISTNDITYPDISIIAAAQKRFGADDNIYGLVCRYLDENNYYSFLVSSDGYYGIAKMYQGNYSLLDSQAMQYSELINQGNAQNLLHVVCSADDLSLYVNGSHLKTVSDGDLTGGRNGFLVGSFENGGELVVAFDDFSLRAQ